MTSKNDVSFLTNINKSVLINNLVYTLDFYHKEDLPEVLSLENTAGPNPWSENNFLSSLNSSHYCVALKLQEALIAHAVLSFMAGEAELLILSVAKEHQGKKIAQHFLSALIRLSKNKATQMFLEVRESNKVAIKVYENIGFNEVGLRKNYYPSLTGSKKKEDALIYAIELFD